MGGQPSAPRASPRTESAFAELHSMRQQREGSARGGSNNPMADSAASMILPRQMGSLGQRPGGLTGQQRTARAAEGAAVPSSSTNHTPSGPSSSGNPFRDAVPQPQGQRTPSGNPFADTPAQSPAQPANTPYSLPSESGGSMGREAASSVNWRTNLAASWDRRVPGSTSIAGDESGAFLGPWPAHDERTTVAPLREGPLAQLHAPWDRSPVGGGVVAEPVQAAM